MLEQKIQRDSSYRPACDLSDTVSCSKPITSKYNTLFFVSNAVVGMLYYLLFFVCAIFELYQLLFAFSIVALLASLVFAWILYSRIKAVCIVCTSIYGVNILLFFLSYYNL